MFGKSTLPGSLPPPLASTICCLIVNASIFTGAFDERPAASNLKLVAPVFDGGGMVPVAEFIFVVAWNLIVMSVNPFTVASMAGKPISVMIACEKKP